MWRHLILIGLAISAGLLSAASVMERNGTPPQVPGAGADGGHDNLFYELNEQIQQQDMKVKRSDKDFLNDLYKDHPPTRNLATPAAAAVCPICKQKYARHGEPGFRCIPVEGDGNPLPFPEIVWKKVQCPCCGVDFKAPKPGNTNAKAGMDRDFCIHSVGVTAVYSNVWTCPECGYAALVDSFGLSWDGTPISPETKNFVQKEIRPVMFKRMCRLTGIREDAINKPDPRGLMRFAELTKEEEWMMSQDLISDWIKYDNAIKIYKQQKAPHALMARLYLESAYACRHELAGDIAIPALMQEIEVRLGMALRLINHDLTAASYQVRRDHNQASMLDPNRMETDPSVLAEAAELIVELGEIDGDTYQAEARLNNRPVDRSKFYSKIDMFVLRLRFAGILDRLGKMDQARRNLDMAASLINTAKLAGDENIALPREAMEIIDKQFKHLADYVDDRKGCIAFEKECLNRAMWESLLALDQKSIHFRDKNNLVAPPEKGALEPAMSAYMIGELARRCDDRLTASAFLAAADALYVKQLTELEKEEDALAPAKDLPDSKAALERARQLRQSWTAMRNWTSEQLTLALQPHKDEAPVSSQIDDRVKQVLNLILQAGGVDSAAFKIPAPIEPKIAPAPEVKAVAKTALPAVTQAAPRLDPSVSTGSLKTREELYKMYYAAIVRYVKEKGANPKSLSALVEGNYVPRDNACLTEKGNLICPETHEALQYFSQFDLGNADQMVLFQTINTKNGRNLFADGKVGNMSKRN